MSSPLVKLMESAVKCAENINKDVISKCALVDNIKAEELERAISKEEKIKAVNEATEEVIEGSMVAEETAAEEETTMVNPIVVEEPTGKLKVDLSKIGNSTSTMKPVETEDPFKTEAFDKLPVLERIKVVLNSNNIQTHITEDPSGLFKVDMFISDAHFGSLYVDRDGCLFNSIPKIVLSINPDITKLEDCPMLALFNSNWPSILTDLTDGKSVSACDCITSQERELNELFDLATIPSKIKDSQRAKTLKNLEMIKMEGILNDILTQEKKTRFRFENFKDSGKFDLVSDDGVKSSLLAPYSAKQPYKVIVDLTKGGDERFVKVSL